ncbi:DUF7010 family protein [Rheinheimera sp.]|uniref:DUF7010 family protein n=1 Tax=Rheinheimera sp. TaxID=1869214 RepID=UPI002FDD3543
MNDSLNAAQTDMRFAYCSGAAGMLASSLIWLASAAAVVFASAQQALWVLLIGGMFIHPLGVVIAKLAGRPGNHSKGNPLAGLAYASTFWLIFSLPLAFAAAQLRIEWFFPAMLLVIGGRYLVFSSLFGMRLFWFCGLALAGAGFVLGQFAAAPLYGALAGGVIELIFALVIFVQDKKAAQQTTFGLRNFQVQDS